MTGDNLLIRGDALSALASLSRLPELAGRYLGRIKLAYLDPPFNTQQSFLHYDDALEHSLWLTMMRDRLEQVRELLATDGSVWVHCDDSEQAHLRVLMDELFGRENFVATVVWERQYTQSNMVVFSTSHDYILLYARDRARFAEARNRLPRTDKQDAAYRNPDNDPRGPWKPTPLQARNPYSLGLYSITTPAGRVLEGPPPGTYWRLSEDKFEELQQDDRVVWGKASIQGFSMDRSRDAWSTALLADLVDHGLDTSRASWSSSTAPRLYASVSASLRAGTPRRRGASARALPRRPRAVLGRARGARAPRPSAAVA